MKQASPKALILADRAKTGDSRLAQAKRLGIPETSLRWLEDNDRWANNKHIRAAQMKALGVKSTNAKKAVLA